jgi:isopentenyl diphosphate isomerase/L-lactate dehydrogenase-like FMN-dependent dehydrogenase
MALPVLRAWDADGEQGAASFLEQVATGLRLAMAFTGARSLAELKARPLVTTERFRTWVSGTAPVADPGGSN